jgi:hypothetical protein
MSDPKSCPRSSSAGRQRSAGEILDVIVNPKDQQTFGHAIDKSGNAPKQKILPKRPVRLDKRANVSNTMNSRTRTTHEQTWTQASCAARCHQWDTQEQTSLPRGEEALLG